MAVAAETTYDRLFYDMQRQREAADDIAAQQAKTANDTAATAEEMQELHLDPQTLGAMADHVDAQQAAGEALRRVTETAEAVLGSLRSGHSALNEAHQAAPGGGAERAFYQG